MTARIVLVLLAACSGVSSEPGLPPLSAIGVACDALHPCAAGAMCGTCGIVIDQCTLPCTGSGSGAAAGCPDGAACSAHFCVRTCTDDPSCRTPTANSELSCNAGTCDVPDSVASANPCH